MLIFLWENGFMNDFGYYSYFFEEHEKLHNESDRIVKKALSAITPFTGKLFFQVKKAFINKDYFVTDLFWSEIFRVFGDKYNRVDYCAECRKFSLYYKEIMEEEKKMGDVIVKAVFTE